MRATRLLLLFSAALLLTYCGEETPQTPGDDDRGGGGGGGTAIDTIAPAAIWPLLVKSPTQQSVALVWDAPGDDGHEGTAAEYDVRYAPDSLTEDTWGGATQFDGETPPKPAGEPETMRVGGLNSLTTYYFGVKTRDEAGNESALSEVVSATTLTELQPPCPITDLVAEAIDQNTYQLTWTAPGDDGVFGQATSYSIRYSRNPITESNWLTATEIQSPPPPKPSGEIEIFRPEGVTGEYNQYFAIKSEDDVGNVSEMSNVAFAIGGDVELFISPNPVNAGEEATVYWRAPGGGQSVSIHVWRFYSTMYQCEQYGTHVWVYGDVFNNWTLPAGLYMSKFDFKFPDGSYFPSGSYIFEMCYWNAMHTTTSVQFINN